MPLSPSLLEILVCPKSKAPLVYFAHGEGPTASEAFLLCPASRLRYRIEGDVPVMLVDEAVSLSEGEVTRLVDLARSQGIPVP
jgi:uncharacterized protein YbaR (Trm112 family)